VQYALIQEVEEVPNLCSAAGVRERKALGTTLRCIIVEVSTYPDALSNSSRMLMLHRLELIVRLVRVKLECSYESSLELRGHSLTNRRRRHRNRNKA
jgi:hypothetical protein